MTIRILSLFCLMFVFLGLRAQAPSLNVWMDDMSVIADGESVTYMTVKMTDPNHLYSGFQMGITVPEGISIHKVKSGRVMVNDAKLNEYRFEGLGHSITINMPDSKTIKVGCMDTRDNAEFYRDDADGNIVEELFTIGLVGSPEMVNGEYTVEMWDVEMIQQNATGIKPANENLSSRMTVTGGVDASLLTIPYHLSESGYGTLILPFQAELPEGVSAFTCTGIEGNTVLMEQQDVIPANTPVIMSGTPGTYTFTGESCASEDSYTEGLLTGVFKATVIDDGYVLQQQNGVIGFYYVDAEEPKTVPANRCYLSVPAGAKMLSLLEDTDGINAIDSSEEAGAYALDGKKVGKKAKGVVIKGGVKIVQQ